ncbi:MAG: PD40 domain-containing protein [Lewinellaceae bacterium]|nr:PD40 domain-containing protein [Lewinellaceae bacterium]
MFSRLLHLCIFLFLAQLLPAQTLTKWLNEADTAFAKKDYYTAYKYYEAGSLYDSTNAYVFYQMGESARMFNAYTAAREAYLRVLSMPDSVTSQYPETRLWLGTVLQKIGDYTGAIDQFRMYKNQQSSRGVISPETSLADRCMADCEWAMQEVERSDRITTRGIAPASNRNLGPTINGIYSDFGGVFVGDTIYYSSFRFPPDPDIKEKDQPKLLIKVLRATPDGQVTVLPADFNVPGKMVAYSAFAPEAKGIYYCLCESLNPAEVRCDMYYRTRQPGNQWGPPLKLGVNVPGKTTTQPSVGIDPDGKAWLYFASNRDGGKGKMDLWRGAIDLETGNVTSAEPLTALNTANDDASPSYHQRSQQLFYSSNDSPTYGGFDVRSSFLNSEGQWGKPINQGTSVNSSYDELYYTRNAYGDKALFASNGWGATYIEEDKEACCYDLYERDVNLDLTLEVLTMKKRDSTALVATTVELYEIPRDGGPEKLVKVEVNPTDNSYLFTLERYKKYRIAGTKDGFIGDERVVDLLGVPDTSLSLPAVKLYLLDVNLTALTLDDRDGSALDSCHVKFYKMEGEKKVLISDLVNPTGNDYHYAILINTPYYIWATKDGGVFDTIEYPILFTQADIDRLGPDITIELPLGPEVTKLSAFVFFENDYPLRTTKDTTSYSVMFNAYLPNKTRYYSEVPKDSLTKMQAFFNEDVAFGMRDLQYLRKKVLEYLNKGYQIEIDLSGFASPRYLPGYNRDLSNRRIKTVKNTLGLFPGGELAKFVSPTGNGQLTIHEEPNGAERSRPGVPAAMKDKASIYSVLAATERRVEVVVIKVIAP